MTLKELICHNVVTFSTDFVLYNTTNYTDSATGWMKLTLPIRRAVNPWMLIETLYEEVRDLHKNEKNS